MGRITALALLSLLVLAAGAPVARAVEAGCERDVFGRPIPAGRPTLVIHANRHTREALRRQVPELTLKLREQAPVVVVRVDLRDVPGFFKGSAHGEIRKSWRKSVGEVRDALHRAGLEPGKDAEHLIYMVADPDGVSHRALGLQKGFRTAVATVLAPDGSTRHVGPLPADADGIVRALGGGQAVARTSPLTAAAIAPTRR